MATNIEIQRQNIIVMPVITAVKKPITKEKEVFEERKSEVSRPTSPLVYSEKIGKERNSITIEVQ